MALPVLFGVSLNVWRWPNHKFQKLLLCASFFIKYTKITKYLTCLTCVGYSVLLLALSSGDRHVVNGNIPLKTRASNSFKHNLFRKETSTDECYLSMSREIYTKTQQKFTVWPLRNFARILYTLYTKVCTLHDVACKTTFTKK